MRIPRQNSSFEIEQLSGELAHRDFHLMVGFLNQLSDEYRAIPHPELRESFEARTNPDNPYGTLFAVRNKISSNIAGFAGIYIEPDNGDTNAHLNELIVDSRFQGYGLGRILLKRCIKWAEDEGADAIQVDIPPTNLAAKKLFTSMDFMSQDPDTLPILDLSTQAAPTHRR